MRIIAGKHRGRKLLPPEGDVTRPITDRVKQSLFDILAPDIPGARVYDCFAGTGSMGLECISRGASAVRFFEADRSALARLKRNIEAVDEEKIAEVISGNLFRWFEDHKEIAPESRADLVFLDPPYRYLKERPEDLQQAAKNIAVVHLNSNGIVVFRHDSADAIDLAPLSRVDQRNYSGMTIEFLRSG
jgi:16S rRNA (guanine966-N2)-methyltransferase